MKLFYVFTLVLLSGSVWSAEDDEKKHKTTITTVTPPTTAPSTPAPPSSTSPPPTTPLPTSPTPPPTPPTSPTPPPTTPSTPPTTPSTPPTTPSTPPTPPSTPPTPPPTSPTTPSTPAPSTPSTPAPPTPSPHPAPHQWLVIDPDTNNPCIIATMAISFHLHTQNGTSAASIDPSSAKAVGGSCGEPQKLGLTWPFGPDNSTLTLTFTENKNNYYVSGLELNLAHNTTGTVQFAKFVGENLTLFETSVNSSYSCGSVEIPEQKNDKKEVVHIKATDLQLEAFKTGNSTTFNSSHYCPGEVPDIVPLIVGIALAGLVLVVVVAYLIGRRRSQARGYLSM